MRASGKRINRKSDRYYIIRFTQPAHLILVRISQWCIDAKGFDGSSVLKRRNIVDGCPRLYINGRFFTGRDGVRSIVLLFQNKFGLAKDKPITIHVSYFSWFLKRRALSRSAACLTHSSGTNFQLLLG